MPKPRNDVPRVWHTPWELAEKPSDTPVLLALSGGADSRALLHMLAADAAAQGFSLTLAHVNHSIRGAEAIRDRDFCQHLADAYGLEIVFLDADVPRLAKEHGRGLEEEAREVRYAFFEKLMQERNIPLLATAHHADDLLETLLFRLARGTGAKGLSSIAPCRPFGTGFLVRPLLEMTREEILAYCAQNDLAYVTDSTNSDTAYARNRIRAEVVPVLESLFAEPQKRVVALAEELREDEAFLEELARSLLCQCRAAYGLFAEQLAGAPDPIRRRALRIWAEEMSGATVGRVQLNALQNLVCGKTPSARVALPGNVAAVLEMGFLRALPMREAEPAIWQAPFCEGIAEIDALGVTLAVFPADRDGLTKINNLSTELYTNIDVKSAIIEKAFYWRNYREGDVILQNGMHKKLRRLYRETGISPRMRMRLPLLCDAEGIVWAPFAGRRDAELNGRGEAYVIRVTINGDSTELPLRTKDVSNKNATMKRNGGIS